MGEFRPVNAVNTHSTTRPTLRQEGYLFIMPLQKHIVVLQSNLIGAVSTPRYGPWTDNRWMSEAEPRLASPLPYRTTYVMANFEVSVCHARRPHSFLLPYVTAIPRDMTTPPPPPPRPRPSVRFMTCFYKNKALQIVPRIANPLPMQRQWR